MKVKTSLTLSKTTLRAVDNFVGKNGNRSAFVEAAVLDFIARKHAELRDVRDAAIYRQHADEYNAFIEDMLAPKWGKR